LAGGPVLAAALGNFRGGRGGGPKIVHKDRPDAALGQEMSLTQPKIIKKNINHFAEK